MTIQEHMRLVRRDVSRLLLEIEGPSERTLFTPKQGARKLGMAYRTFAKKARRGEILLCRVGRGAGARRAVTSLELERFRKALRR